MSDDANDVLTFPPFNDAKVLKRLSGLSIKTVPAVADHIVAVLSDPSEATLLDIDALGFCPHGTIDYFLSKVPEADAVAFIEGGKVLAVFGWDKHPGMWFSWLLTTPQFLTADPGPVFAARKHMRSVRRKYPDQRLLSLVTSETSDVSRWMRCIGYKRLIPLRENLWQYA